VFFSDGTSTDKVAIDYPIGHRNRRGEGIPVLVRKFEDALAGHLPARRVSAILRQTQDPARFEATPIHKLLDLFAS
jgi:2-methylcitrate dehydratase